MNVIPSSYYDVINPIYLSRDFYESYTDKTPPWGPLGALVFIRTYSHYIPDLDISLAKAKNFRRREKWQEVCLRVVEYNMSLEPDNVRTYEEKKEEAEKLYDLFFNLKAFPSGRTLWVGGTQKIKEDGSANFNCSFVTIDNLTKFSETFYMLLVGAGVGFSVESRYTKDLPLFNKDTKTNHVLDNRHKLVAFRKEHTTVIVKATDTEGNLTKKRVVLDNFNPADGYNPLSLITDIDYKKLEIDIEVGDSKKGWSSALYVYLFSLTIYGEVVINVNYNQVRPAGERLRTFGGTASGPEPLRRMFRKFHWKIVNSKGEVDTDPNSLFSMVRLTNTDLMDIENMIAEGVVCGGVRRSSLICLFSEDDEETRTCKVDLWDWKHDKEIEELLKQLEEAGYPTDNANTDVLWATERLLPVVIDREVTELTFIGEWVKRSLYWLSAALKISLDFSKYKDMFSTTFKVKEVIHPAKIVAKIDELAPKYRYRRSRVMSNNSVALRNSATLDELHDYFEAIKSNGEPGFVSMLNAEARRPNFKGVNPCGEILLDDRATCNLTTRNFLAFVKSDGTFDKQGYLEASILLTRWSYRITMVKMFSEKWDTIQQRDRLLGLSFTGLTDGLVKLGWSDTGEEIKAFYKEDRELIEAEGIRYSKLLGLEQPLLSTTVKPEGTLSLLAGVSSGIHKGYSPYFIRRIRVASVDPVCKVLKDLGVPNCPENGQKEETADTTVFTFYVKTEANMRAIDEPVESQLERYKTAMSSYVDHNCSVTVTLDSEKGEYEKAAQWLYDNPTSYVGVSFLPKYDPLVASYPNMPFEPISEEVYYQDKHDTEVTEDKLIELLTKYENDTYSDIHDVAPDCATGNCPVR